MNFALNICKCIEDWEMSKFVESSIKSIKEYVKDEHVILGLSGGVDSSVVAAILHRAIGNQLHCVYVDNGLMRLNETDEIKELFGNAFGIDLHIIDAGNLFLNKLNGVSDPERKEKSSDQLLLMFFLKKLES